MKVPTIGSQIGSEPTISADKSYTAPQTEWVLGKVSCVTSGESRAYITLSDDTETPIAGIPFLAYADGNSQAAFCFILRKGQSIEYKCENGGKFEKIKYRDIEWAEV